MQILLNIKFNEKHEINRMIPIVKNQNDFPVFDNVFFLSETKTRAIKSSIDSIRSIVPTHTHVSFFLDFQINMFPYLSTG